MIIVFAALAVLVGLVAVLISQPLVRRFALRNVVRRPREAMLVMLGCLLGTSLVVGSFAVGDSFIKSVSDDAVAALGPLDAIVSFDNAETWGDGNRRLASLESPGVRASAAVATLETPMTAGDAAAAPQARLLEMDYARAARLGQPADTGLSGRGPAAGHAWASPSLAAELGIKSGDSVQVHAGRSVVFVVDRVAPEGALTEFRETATGSKSNLLVAPGTIGALIADNPRSPSPQYLSVVAGPALKTSDVVPPVAVTNQLRRTLTTAMSGLGATVNTVKADRLADAKSFGEGAKFFLTIIGAFGIAAGVLLLINVFIMLAEERLAELGTMRAVGLSRRPFVAAFSAEGCIYSLVGAAIGGLVGLGLGRVMVGFAASSLKGDVGTDAGVNLAFSISRTSLMVGIASGFLVSVVVVVLTSVRISYMNVISAIRVLPEGRRPNRRAGRRLAVFGVLAGIAMTVAGRSAGLTDLLVGGPIVSLACVGVVLRSWLTAQTAITVVGIPIILWGGWLFVYFTGDGAQVGPSLMVILGLTLTTAGVLIANAQQARVANLLRLPLGARSGTTVRLGLAYPVARRVRTALTVAPFALVIFTLTYTEGLSHLITHELKRVAPRLGGDYHVFVDSSATNPYTFADLESAADVRHVATTSTLLTSVARPGDSIRSLWPLTAFDANLANVKPPPLVARAPGYSSDTAVYRAVATDADSVIVSANFLLTRRGNLAPEDGKEPLLAPEVGQVFTVYDVASDRARELTIAGVTYSDVTSSGMFYGRVGAQALFGERLKPTSAFVAVKGDTRAFAQRIERAGAEHGVRATVIIDAARETSAFIGDLVNLYRSDLGIGLVVGVAGIGVVLIRSVRERNRQIGTLRAMGFEARQIGRSFLIEGAFVGLQGLTVGIGLGALVVFTQGKTDAVKEIFGYYPPMPPPPLSVAILGLTLLLAALLASVGPARAASRIPPAVALRLVD